MLTGEEMAEKRPGRARASGELGTDGGKAMGGEAAEVWGCTGSSGRCPRARLRASTLHAAVLSDYTFGLCFSI